MFAFLRRRKLRKRVAERRDFAKRILHAEDDILSPKAKDTLRAVVKDAEAVELTPKAVEAFAVSAESRIETAFPRRGWFYTVRDWLDVVAVAMAVAFGIRALYLQPFKIPTSSMQPTLFGIHYVKKDVVPQLGSFADYWLFSARRAYLQTMDGGEAFFSGVKGGFTPSMYIRIGRETYELPCSTERPANQLLDYFGRRNTFEPGEVVCDGWLSLGDHLFVDRLSFHLLGLERGDVTVFSTEGINFKPQSLAGFYYIKRLAGMPGDSLKIEHGTLLVKPKGADSFKPVYELSKKFEKVYSMKGGYQGHIIPDVPPEIKQYMTLSEEGQVITVPDDAYFMMGDNTANSLDSRYWGFVPRRNIVGTGGIVFWPFSRRWGITDTKAPLPSPTELPRSFWLQ